MEEEGKSFHRIVVLGKYKENTDQIFLWKVSERFFKKLKDHNKLLEVGELVWAKTVNGLRVVKITDILLVKKYPKNLQLESIVNYVPDEKLPEWFYEE